MYRQCLGSASAVEQPPTAIPRTRHGQAKIDQKLPLTTASTRFSKLLVRDLDVEFCVTGALIQESLWALKSKGFWNFTWMWNFKGYLWNSTQNIVPIHWKIRILYSIEILIAFRFRSSHVFEMQTCVRGLSEQCQWGGDVIKWIHFPRHWPFVRGIRRSPMTFRH